MEKEKKSKVLTKIPIFIMCCEDLLQAIIALCVTAIVILIIAKIEW